VGQERLPIETFAGPLLPQPLRDAIAARWEFCSHNAAGFDQLVWRGQGLPEPVAWLDTLPAARVAGLPGELDKLGKRLLGLGKGEGKELVRRLCRPNPSGQFPEIAPADAIQLIQYNVGDVLLLARVHAEVVAHAEP